MGAIVDWDDVFVTAALDPARWPDSLARMAHAVGASHGQLIGIGGERELSFSLVTGAEGWPLRAMTDSANYAPQTNFRVAANTRASARGRYDPILSEADYDAVMPALTERRYVELCEEIDVPNGCQTNLVVDGVGLVGLATLRKRGEGRTTPAQLRVFARAAAAARRAVRLQERLEGQQAQLLAGTFDALAMPAFVLDARGRVLARSEAAEALLSAGDVVLCDGIPSGRGTPHSLRRAVGLLTMEGGPAHVQLRVDRKEQRSALYIEGFRLPARTLSLGRLPHAILVEKRTRRDRAGVAAFLGAIYRLTAAESHIAMRMYEGRSRDDIATERGVTVETLRGQIKSVYAKLGVANEAGLVRRLAAFMG